MRNMNKMKIKFLWFGLLLVPFSALAQPAKNDFDEDAGKVKATAVLTIDQAWQRLPNYKFGDSLVPLKTIEKAVAASPKTDAERADLAAKLGAILDNPNATKDARKFVCRLLAIIGDDKQIPALSALLLGNDEELSFAGRYALERMPSASALQALRDALTKTKGATLAGVIDSLGVRGDFNSIGAIAAAMREADDLVMRSALNAIGAIGGTQSLETLAQVGFPQNSPLVAVAQASALRVADGLLKTSPTQAAPVYKNIMAANSKGAIHIAAWRGVVKTTGEQAAPMVIEALKSNDKNLQTAAMGVINDLPKGAFISVANAIANLPEDSQILVFNAMTSYDVPAVRSAALAVLNSKNENVRIAALNALSMSGDVSTIAALTKVAANGSAREKPVAQNTLERLRGDTIDAALIQHLEKASPNERAVLAKALGNRHAPNATEVLLKAAGDVEANVRLAALEALSQTAQPNDVPTLLELQSRALNADKRELLTLEKTTVAAVQNGSDTEAALNSVLIALKDAAPLRKASLLRIVGAIGGPKANAALMEAAKDNDETIRDAAIRTLAVSSDQKVAPALLDLAQNAISATHKVLAFRGYVRLADDKNLKNSERLKMYGAALPVAPASEKKLVLGGLGNIGSADALKLVAPFLEDADMREEAAAAINTIAAKMLAGAVAEKDKEPLRAALKKVLEISKNEAQRKQSADNLQKLG